MTISSSDLVRLYIEDDSGTPFPQRDLLKWADWYTSHDTIVATTHIDAVDGGDSTVVQTAFLGFSLDPASFPPLLYESLVFQGTRLMDRVLSDSRESATEAHEELVNSLTALQ